MKSILIFILFEIVCFPLFSMEEIWSDQSFGDEIKEGLIYKVDFNEKFTCNLLGIVDDDPVKNKLILKASGAGGEDFTHISFNPNATAGLDKEYDAFKYILSVSKRPVIFTYADTIKLSINQLPDTTMLDMSVSAGIDGNYTISVDQVVNFDFVVLEDLILHTKTDLLKSDYNFEYFTSDGNYPFKLYFKDWVLQPLDESDIEIYYYPESIVVRSKKQVDIAEIIFFDLAGRIVDQYFAKSFFRFEKHVNLPTGHYIVQLRSADVVKNLKIFVL